MKGERESSIAMEEGRIWMELALVVPETLLFVGTSEGILTSISDAYKLLGEDIWGAEGTDKVESASNTITGGAEHSYGFGVHLDTTCGGEQIVRFPLFTSVDGGQSYGFGLPFNTTRGGDRVFNTTGSRERDFGCFQVLLDRSGGGERTFGFGVPTESICGDEIEITLDDTTPYDERFHDMLIDVGYDHWANLLASALAPTGPLPAAHREITRLISLHGEASHVLDLCAEHLGLRQDDDPTWKRWSEDRGAFLPKGHDALLRLRSAASAAAAAEDFLRWRSPGSTRRKEWGAVARRLVSEARYDVLEARGAVKLMRDAAVREFFQTWMILKHA